MKQFVADDANFTLMSPVVRTKTDKLNKLCVCFQAEGGVAGPSGEPKQTPEETQ